MKGLSTLKLSLSKAKNLSDIEPGELLAPFLEIIRSEETTGSVTRLALLAIKKFISYGLIGKFINLLINYNKYLTVTFSTLININKYKLTFKMLNILILYHV